MMKPMLFTLLVTSSALAQQAVPAAPAVREVSAGVELEQFAGDDWLQLHAALRLGPLVLRATRGERGDLDDAQLEVEAYPKLGSRSYAYFAGAVSSESVLYPEWRAAAEYYQSFGKGFEASAGYRRLAFDEPVDLFTASLGRYVGNWLVAGRAFEAKSDWSWQALARRYLDDAGSYAGIRAGTAREEIRSGADLAALDSREAAFEAFYVAPSRWTLGGRAGVIRRSGENDFTGSLSVGRRF